MRSRGGAHALHGRFMVCARLWRGKAIQRHGSVRIAASCQAQAGLVGDETAGGRQLRAAHIWMQALARAEQAASVRSRAIYPHRHASCVVHAHVCVYVCEAGRARQAA